MEIDYVGAAWEDIRQHVLDHLAIGVFEMFAEIEEQYEPTEDDFTWLNDWYDYERYGE